MRRFPLLADAARAKDRLIEHILTFADDDAAAYLCGLVELIAATLGIARPIVRSSTLPIDPELRGQDRVIAIVRYLGGTRYLNPSGGRELYDAGSFTRSGIELRFLTPYAGAIDSVLSRLLAEPREELVAEIVGETHLVP